MKFNKMNIEPRIIIFLGGLIALTGTFLTIYGTLMHNKASSEKSTKILEAANKSLLTSKESLEKAIESLDKLVVIQEENKKINDHITGGNSYPHLYLKRQENNGISAFYLKIEGDYSLKNTKFTSLNISNVERFHKSNPRDLIAERSRTIFVSQESILKYKDEKQKAYTSNTKLKDGDYHPKIDKFVGNQSFDFSESTNGVATAILIEASNGNYYHLFNWGLIFSYSKSPSYNSLIEEVLFDENGKILYENFSKHDWFFYPQYKLNKLKDISFENIKKYFDEKKKMIQ